MAATHVDIQPEEARRRWSEYFAIDVREETELSGPLGRLAGALHLPLGELEGRAGELPKARALLLICRSGNRSGKACEKLAKLGFGSLANLAGGMIAWNEAGLPVERSSTEP